MSDLKHPRPLSAGTAPRWFGLALLSLGVAALVVPALPHGLDGLWLLALIPLRLIVSLGVIYGPALIVTARMPNSTMSREVLLAACVGVAFSFAGGFWLSGGYALVALVPFPGDLPWMTLALGTVLARVAPSTRRARPLQAGALACFSLASGLLLWTPSVSDFAQRWPGSIFHPLLAAYDAAAPSAWIVPLALALLFISIDRQERARAECPA